METQLLRFITTLRKNDLAVSTAETLDAMAVAGVIGGFIQRVATDAVAERRPHDSLHRFHRAGRRLSPSLRFCYNRLTVQRNVRAWRNW